MLYSTWLDVLDAVFTLGAPTASTERADPVLILQPTDSQGRPMRQKARFGLWGVRATH
jgi:hypothetical protein